MFVARWTAPKAAGLIATRSGERYGQPRKRRSVNCLKPASRMLAVVAGMLFCLRCALNPAKPPPRKQTLWAKQAWWSLNYVDTLGADEVMSRGVGFSEGLEAPIQE